jgi:hypothetical protein
MNDNQHKKPSSRNNSKRSPGPTSEAGKRRSSQNAYKHGFFALRLFPTDEIIARDGDGYNQILAAYRSHYSPVGDLENSYVEQIAVHSLRLTRILRHEQKVFAWSAPFEARSVDRIVRYESNISRLRDKTIDRLERLQAARQAESSQLDLLNLAEDDAISNDDASEGLNEAPQEPELGEPQDGRTSSSGRAAIPAKPGLDVETGSKQESAAVDGEQPNEVANPPAGSAAASGSTLVKTIEKAAGLPPAEERKSPESRESPDTYSVGSNNFVESREDERIKRGDDVEEPDCI